MLSSPTRQLHLELSSELKHLFNQTYRKKLLVQYEFIKRKNSAMLSAEKHQDAVDTNEMGGKWNARKFNIFTHGSMTHVPCINGRGGWGKNLKSIHVIMLQNQFMSLP